MIDSELPFSYDKICSNVRHTLIEYDKYEENIPRKEIELSLNKMYQKQGRIREKLDIAESNAIDIVDNWESFHQWFSVLKDTNKEMDVKEKEDETELGRLRLAFSSNANQLKSLEGDILACCRKLPDTKESPQVIRLKCVYSKAKEYLYERSQVLSDISNELVEAEKKYDQNSKENTNLIQQNDEFQKQLDLFSNSESFRLVQEARKHLLIEKEWKDKKTKLLIDIENSTKELENYLGNKDQSLRALMLESNKQDQEVAKLQLKYNEVMQDVINEDNISNTNRATVMKQLHVELGRLQQNQLRKESNITRSEVRMLKNKGDRLVSKLKMEIANSSRTFSQVISKLTESQPNTNSNTGKNSTSNYSRFKNLKGKKKKNSSKSPKKKKNVTDPTPKEPPPRAYTLQELGLMKLEEDKAKYLIYLKSKFDPEISELKQFFERKINIHEEMHQQELSDILNRDKRQRDLLIAHKIRTQQRISEKDIEILSLNSELATFEDMVKDYQSNCIQIEKRNEELRKKSLDVLDPSKFIDLRKNIESLDSFIASTKEYINIFNSKMGSKIESSNQNTNKINDIDNLNSIKTIPKSKSLNDIQILDQKQFVNKPTKEITKERKARTESSLSIISRIQPSNQKYNTKADSLKPSSPIQPVILTDPSIQSNEKEETMQPINLIQPKKQIDIQTESSQIITKTININEKENSNRDSSKVEINPNESLIIETISINNLSETKQESEVASSSVKELNNADKKLTISSTHFDEFVSNSSSSSSSQHIISSNNNEISILSESIASKSIGKCNEEEEEKEEEKHDNIITKVETENPSLNVTQPPSCQTSNEKPKSQLQYQIRPPVDQLHYIRKAPTLNTDMRAFTIEARVSSATVPSNTTSDSNSSPTPKSLIFNPSHLSQTQTQSHFRLSLNASNSITNDSSFPNYDINAHLIEMSEESYRIVGDSDDMQLQERKKKNAQNPNLNHKQSKTKLKSPNQQLVLFSVTPMSMSSRLNKDINPIQVSQINNKTVHSKKRRSNLSATSSSNFLQSSKEKKEKRFTIYATNDQSMNQPIIVSARRRVMGIENKVRVTKQKRRSNVQHKP